MTEEISELRVGPTDEQRGVSIALRETVDKVNEIIRTFTAQVIELETELAALESSIAAPAPVAEVATPVETTVSEEQFGSMLTDFGVFIKPTPQSPNTIDAIPNSSTRRRTSSNYVDGAGRVVRVYDSAGEQDYDGELLGDGANRAVAGLNSSGDVQRDVPPLRIHYQDGTQFDTLRPAEPGAQVTNGKSLTVLTDRNLDNIDDTLTYRRPGSGYVDGSGRVSGVFDPAVGYRDGGQIGSGVSRANSGLNGSGDVQRSVPLIHAVTNIPALANGDGLIDRTQAFSGSFELPESTFGALTKSVVSSRERAYVPHHMWDFRGGLEGFSTVQIFAEHDANFVRLRSTGNDPQLISPPIAFPGARFPVVRIRIRRLEGSSWDGALYYATATHSFSGSFFGITPPPLAGTNPNHPWEVLELDMSQAAQTVGGADWINSAITQLRFDFGLSASDVFDVDWIALGSYSPNVGDLRPYAEGGTLRDRVGLVGQQTVRISGGIVSRYFDSVAGGDVIHVSPGHFANGPVNIFTPEAQWVVPSNGATYFIYYSHETAGMQYSQTKTVANNWDTIYLGFVTVSTSGGGGSTPPGDGGGVPIQ